LSTRTTRKESSGQDGAARRASLRAVVTKTLAGGLAAYLCASERGTLRLRSNCSVAGRAGQLCCWVGPEPGCQRGSCLLGARQFRRPSTTPTSSSLVHISLHPSCSQRFPMVRSDSVVTITSLRLFFAPRAPSALIDVMSLAFNESRGPTTGQPIGAEASFCSRVCVSESVLCVLRILALAVLPRTLGVSQCPGSSTHGGCSKLQLLQSPLAQDSVRWPDSSTQAAASGVL
jgi:hypothetical protein